MLAAAVGFIATTAAPRAAHALNCTWQAGSAVNWNTSTANWSCSRLPTSADSVIFSGASSNFGCTMNVDTTVVDYTINGSYTGAITSSGGDRLVTVTGNFTQGATSSTFTTPILLTVGGTLSITAGTFNSAESVKVTGSFSQSGGTFVGTTGALLVAGNFTLSTGAFTAPTRLSVSGNFNYTGGTFTTTGSTVFLTPRAAATPTHVFGGAAFNSSSRFRIRLARPVYAANSTGSKPGRTGESPCFRNSSALAVSWR